MFTFVIFDSQRPTGSVNMLYQLGASRQESNIVTKKKYTKLYMYKTICDVSALTSISLEINHLYNFAQYPKQKFFAFSQPPVFS